MKNFRSMTAVVLALTTAAALTACSSKLVSNGNTTATATPAVSTGTIGTASTDFTGKVAELTNFDQNTEYSLSDDTVITLNGESATVSGEGAVWDGGTLTISAEGTYIISGTLSNGSIYVNADSSAKVHIVLNGASITCQSGPAIYIANADKTTITLAEGTENSLTDGASYNDASACLFSKDDLSINGTGSLTVTANNNNGIGCKNDLRIASGTITVNAANNGIKGNDSVGIFGGTITITAGKDGIKSDNDTDTEKGYVYITGGTFTITASDDAIQADTSLGILGGTFTIKALDSKFNCKTYCYTEGATTK